MNRLRREHLAGQAGSVGSWPYGASAEGDLDLLLQGDRAAAAAAMTLQSSAVTRAKARAFVRALQRHNHCAAQAYHELARHVSRSSARVLGSRLLKTAAVQQLLACATAAPPVIAITPPAPSAPKVGHPMTTDIPTDSQTMTVQALVDVQVSGVRRRAGSVFTIAAHEFRRPHMAIVDASTPARPATDFVKQGMCFAPAARLPVRERNLPVAPRATSRTTARPITARARSPSRRCAR